MSAKRKRSKRMTKKHKGKLITRGLRLYQSGAYAACIDTLDRNNSNPSYSVEIELLRASCHHNLKNDNRAIHHARNALSLNPKSPEILVTIATILKSGGEYENAIEILRSLAERKVTHYSAYKNLGDMLRDTEGLSQANSVYKNASELFPDNFRAQFDSGVCSAMLNDYQSAIAAFQKAIRLEPENDTVLTHLGIAYSNLKMPVETEKFLKKSIETNKNNSRAIKALGNFYFENQNYESAVPLYERAIELEPENQYLVKITGRAYYEVGRAEESLKKLTLALQLDPLDSEAYLYRGICYRAIGDLKNSEHDIKLAIEKDKSNSQAFNELGNLYIRSFRFELAIKYFKSAISINPNYPIAYANLGSAYQASNNYSEAIKNYATALDLKPNYANCYHQLRHLMSLQCNWDTRATEILDLDKVDKYYPPQPFSVLSHSDEPLYHRKISEWYSYKECGSIPLRTFPEKDSCSKRLKIGYFSGNFHAHPVTRLVERVIELHDRNSFEVFGFRLSNPKQDSISQRISRRFDTFKDVARWSDVEIANLARSIKLDIAIDLDGYTENSRCRIFAYGCAPIQINMLGYPGSMGSQYYHYIVADPYLIPPESQSHYSEKPIYLPIQYQPQNDNIWQLAKNMSKRDVGFPEDAFVFCAIHNTYKISPQVFRIWMKILGRCQGSVLWLLETSTQARENLLAEAQKFGIGAERLFFTKKAGYSIYLSQLQTADLFLDTFVYSAGATASDALWAGVPVLSKPGLSYASRMSSSLLVSLDLEELIADTDEDYEDLAVELASKEGKLVQIREKLNINRSHFSFSSSATYTKFLESGFSMAFERYSNNSPLAPIYVTQ